MAFDVDRFVRGFISALIEAECSSIQPKKPEHRKGFYKIQQFLDDNVRRARESDDRDWLKQVVRLRNRLAPGPTGAFDRFETALRDLQLSFSESPNVFYEDIVFTVSRPFAESTLDRLSPRERKLVKEAAKIFVETATV